MHVVGGVVVVQVGGSLIIERVQAVLKYELAGMILLKGITIF